VKSVFFLFSLILAPYSFANFKTEINTGIALQKLKKSNDINIYALTIEHFDKQISIKGPLAEAAYLNKTSSWYVAALEIDIKDSTLGILGRTQFFNENTYVDISTNLQDGNSFQDASLTAGHYLDDFLRISATTSFSKGEGWDEYILFSAKKLFELNNDQNITFEYSTAIEDEAFLEYQSATLTYYPIDFSSLSLGISHDTKERKGTYIDLSAQYYFTMEMEISAGYGFSNHDEVGNFWILSASYRF